MPAMTRDDVWVCSYNGLKIWDGFETQSPVEFMFHLPWIVKRLVDDFTFPNSLLMLAGVTDY